MTWLYSSLHAKWKYEMKCTIGKKNLKSGVQCLSFQMHCMGQKILGSESFTRWLVVVPVDTNRHNGVSGCEEDVLVSPPPVSTKSSNKFYYSNYGLSVPTT